jgi:hypothetical protein
MCDNTLPESTDRLFSALLEDLRFRGGRIAGIDFSGAECGGDDPEVREDRR